MVPEVIRTHQLTNASHLKFFRAILLLMTKYTTILVKIEDQYLIIQACVEKEDLCFKIIRKSNFSALKKRYDKDRDTLVIGMKGALNSSLRHVDENVREAAEKLIIVFNTYNYPKAIQNLPFDEETIVINNMLIEMEKNYAVEIDIVGLRVWIEGLRVKNDAFDKATTEYNVEQAGKPSFHPREVRKETDKAYQNFITVIESLIIREGDAEYAPFISELNTLIKHYNDRLAQHLGRLHAEKEKEKEKEKQADVKTEDVKSNVAKAEDVKSDATKVEDVKSDTAKAEDVQSDATKSDAVKSDTAKSDDTKTDDMKTKQ
jgi:hypothetical protein